MGPALDLAANVSSLGSRLSLVVLLRLICRSTSQISSMEIGESLKSLVLLQITIGLQMINSLFR